ncbi:dienelactone hydrolase family protein [Nevskia ramosa]|uniref:dienelactone hydrolase family protein n=1 Tax=Nevskia ramosa TaxID=64002 RepID=UPI002353FA1C|nr:dienelactone hydrolase family protein [Nevskia ramosa]
MHPDAIAFVSPSEMNRRGFIVTALASGFALAVQPVSAQSLITTPADGLLAGEISIPVKDGKMPAYRAQPRGGRNLPTVLVVQEIFGVHEHIKDVCRRFAQAGYLAIAPELFARQGDASKYTDTKELVAQLVSKVPDAQVMDDLDATAIWAASNGGDPAKLAVTGFCWGGRIVWLYAAHNPVVKAGVAWYGGLIRPGTELQPQSPIDLVDQLKAPVLGLYGAADTGIATDTVDQMLAKLAASASPAAKASEIVLYPDTPHGFNADYRPSYRAAQAKDGWARLLDWFSRNGVA